MACAGITPWAQVRRSLAPGLLYYLGDCPMRTDRIVGKFRVEVVDKDLMVSTERFCAIYYKSSDQPQLVLRIRTQTDDQELLVKAWQAANEKARELGWIV